jgi:MscS family membrane protein
MIANYLCVSLSRALFLSSCLLLAPFCTYAQKNPEPAPSKEEPTKPTDPLRRYSPHGTITGFLKAAEQRNYQLAAAYLQLPRRRPSARDEVTASQLAEILNRVYYASLDKISRHLDGDTNDGLPANLESIGMVNTRGDRSLEIKLTQVSDSNYGKIWLFSSETTTHVAEFHAAMPLRVIERSMPKWMVRSQVLGMMLWEWIAFLLALGLAWIVARAAIGILSWLLRRYRRLSHDKLSGRPAAQGPLTLALTVILHYWLVMPVLPLLYLQYYRRVVHIMFGVAFYWLIARITDHAVEQIQARLAGGAQGSAKSLLVLGRRVWKALVALVLVLLFLKSFGFDVDSALAGIGIGGIALGLGAQKTLENLFGGVSVLSDGTLRVGDFCKVGDQQGTVEDIGLRSTRIRTPGRTLVSVPNGTVASMSLENITEREKILFNPVLSLRYETSADQLRYVLIRIRELLDRHPSVESETSRVRLIGFGASSLDIQVFAYVLTTDYVEFLGFQEDLLLQVMDAVEQSGSGFAFPSQTTYLGRDPGMDPEKAKAALAAVAQWRAEGRFGTGLQSRELRREAAAIPKQH